MKIRRTTTTSHRNIVTLLLVMVILLFSLLITTPQQQELFTFYTQLERMGMFHDYGGGEENNDDTSLAFQHSNGFFDDISNSEWQRMQAHVQQMQPNMCQNKGDRCSRDVNENAAEWFQSNFEPEFACRHERRIGGKGDGGKWVCDPHRLQKKKDCLVYSVGSHNMFQFEEGVFANLGTHCEVHTFDPLDYSRRANRIRNLQEPSTISMLRANNITYGPGTNVPYLNLNYHPWGIANESDTTTSSSGSGTQQFLTVEDTVRKLGHVGRTIHLFKIDCEGCEKTSFESWLNFKEPSFLQLQQVLVEVHAENGHLDEVKNFFLGMNRHGYVMFHKEINLINAAKGSRSKFCSEFSFLKLQPEFFFLQ